jgi:hypothetical protein
VFSEGLLRAYPEKGIKQKEKSMPGKTENEKPVKLRVHVTNDLHQRLVQLCGLQTLEEGRMVTMTELLRELLERGVNQELCQTAKVEESSPTVVGVVSTEGGTQ